MICFDYVEMDSLIYEVADNKEKQFDPELVDTLNVLLDEFNQFYVEAEKIRTVVEGNQICYDSEEYKQRLKNFKKLSKDDIYEIAIQMGFMYGVAYGAKFGKKK